MKCELVFLLSAIVAGVMSCETACTKEMNPVCGTDGVNFQVFSNACMMNNQRCRDGKFWLKSDIRSCSIFQEIVPFVIDSAKFDHVVPACLTICPIVAAPVCGYDGNSYKIFGNSCAMNNENCLLNGGAEKKYVDVPLEKCNQISMVQKARFAVASNCDVACPAIYQPTCGYNGQEFRVFGSRCSMGAYNCFRSENWQTVDDTFCPQEFYDF